MRATILTLSVLVLLAAGCEAASEVTDPGTQPPDNGLPADPGTQDPGVAPDDGRPDAGAEDPGILQDPGNADDPGAADDGPADPGSTDPGTPPEPPIPTSSHTGWKEPDCTDCHDSTGHRAGLEPYQCVACHGRNGAPDGHGRTTCTGCHNSKHGFTPSAPCLACHPN